VERTEEEAGKERVSQGAGGANRLPSTDPRSSSVEAAAQVRLPHEGHLPLALARWAGDIRRAVFVATDDAMLRVLAAALRAFLPKRPIHVLPAWDTPPYDRSQPPRSVTGQRVATLAWLAEHQERAALVLTTPESLLQRIPPADRLLERSVRLATGQPVDIDWLAATLAAFGYELVERVSEPGDAAIHQSTVDIFPGGAVAPLRLEMRWDDQQHTAFQSRRSA
jgi:transcription-repair coupling factor (superfamily II helicase)